MGVNRKTYAGLLLSAACLLFLSSLVYWPPMDSAGSAYKNGLETITYDYYKSHGKYPESLEELSPKLLKDFWGYQVKFISEPQLLVIISPGPDGIFATGDDVVFLRNKDRTRILGN